MDAERLLKVKTSDGGDEAEDCRPKTEGRQNRGFRCLEIGFALQLTSHQEPTAYSLQPLSLVQHFRESADLETPVLFTLRRLGFGQNSSATCRSPIERIYFGVVGPPHTPLLERRLWVNQHKTHVASSRRWFTARSMWRVPLSITRRALDSITITAVRAISSPPKPKTALVRGTCVPVATRCREWNNSGVAAEATAPAPYANTTPSARPASSLLSWHGNLVLSAWRQWPKLLDRDSFGPSRAWLGVPRRNREIRRFSLDRRISTFPVCFSLRRTGGLTPSRAGWFRGILELLRFGIAHRLC